MKLVDPEITGLYEVQDHGKYRVVAFLPAVESSSNQSERSRVMIEVQYRRFQNDRLLLNGLLAIEEAYDVMMGNYLELEETVLKLSVLEMAQRRPHGRDDHFDTARRSCHRALANLLSASRAFEDHSLRLASSIGGSAGKVDLEFLKNSLSRSYDTFVGYRFMSALRNHTQHFGVSVSGVSHMRAVADPAGNSREQYVTTTPFIRISDLRENGNFKTSVLAEIEDVATSGPAGEMIIAVIPMARQYLSGISSVMAEIRDHYRDREFAALNLIYSAFYHYSGWFTKNGPVGLTVAPEPNPEGKVTYFGTDTHFKALSLREVNRDLALLPLMGVRQ